MCFFVSVLQFIRGKYWILFSKKQTNIFGKKKKEIPVTAYKNLMGKNYRFYPEVHY